MCGSNTIFFLVLCGMLFVLLGFLVWIASKDDLAKHPRKGAAGARRMPDQETPHGW